MRALVTGGAGFIGSNLTKLLLEEGWEVTIYDNLSTGYETNIPSSPHLSFVRGDILEKILLWKIMKGNDVVFHLAASVGNQRSIQDPFKDSSVNLLGTLNILEGARSHGIKKVIYSSSAGIFGEVKKLPLAEDHPLAPLSPYGVSKLGGELQCRAYTHLYGLETICLRYFNVYGPYQRFDAYGNVIPIFVKNLLTQKPIQVYGDGKQTRDFINVRDVARANFLAAKARGLSGFYNIGSGHSITINELIRLMKECSKLETFVNYVEPRKGDVRDSLADISAAERDLKFKPAVSLKEGLHEYIEWTKNDAL